MVSHAILPFLVLLPIFYAKIDESSVKVKGSVEEVTISNLFPLIKQNDTWLDTLDVHPGTQNEYKKVPYELATSVDENGRTLYHTRIRLRTREADDTTEEPIVEAVEETPPHSDVPLTENSEDTLPEVEATIESGPTNRTDEFFPNPPAFTLSRLFMFDYFCKKTCIRFIDDPCNFQSGKKFSFSLLCTKGPTCNLFLE